MSNEETEIQSGRTSSGPLSKIRQTIREMARPRVLLVAACHVVVFAAAFWIAFGLRFDFAIPQDSYGVFWKSLPYVLALKIAVFFFAGQFHGWWRHVTFADLTALLKTTALALVIVGAVDHFILPYQVPRSVLIIDTILAAGLVGALRSSWRMFQEGVKPAFRAGDGRVALMIGADQASGKLAHQINSHPELGYRIRGFIDRDGNRRGSHLGQIPVLGGEGDLEAIAAQYSASDILVSAENLPGNRLRDINSRCKEANLELKIIPPPEERFNGADRIPIREIQINDLLRREPVKLDTESIERLVAGRAVMVTGAGGSIGSEICRQLLKFHPSDLILVDQAENNVFSIDREVQHVADACGTKLSPCVADVTDRRRMHDIFARLQPALVFHAAAHKHVPLMELNVGEALFNNVIGTKNVADLSDEFGVKRFVMISTDKAVNPTSVMGVTKQLAERYVHSLSQVAAHTEYVAVRFGNVLGSVGSVVPIFQEQIRNGGPVTITDDRMRRFFMTIPEASQLVLQAAAMGRGGEIFVLDMGEPVRIFDLAKDLIRLSGLPRHAIDIEVVGMRPGEKLFEELYFDEEDTLPTEHPKVRAAYHRFCPYSEVRQTIDEIRALMGQPDELIRAKLVDFVPEYLPDGPLRDGPVGEPLEPAASGPS